MIMEARYEPIKQRCSAVSSRTGEPCRNWAMHGGTVCYKHGGAAPQTKAASARRLAAARAAKALDRVEVIPLGDPIFELEELAAEMKAWKDHIANHVASLTGMRYESKESSEQLRAEVALFERAMDRLARTLKDLASLGLEERRVQITEAQAATLAAVMRAVLIDLGVWDDPRRTETLARHWPRSEPGRAIDATSEEAPWER